MTETKTVLQKIDEFINNSLNPSAALHPRLVASFGLPLSAWHFWDSCPAYHPITTCLFNNFPVLYA
jgi:hypothetical protein